MNMELNNQWLVIGAWLAGLAVALGAFGAHGLADRVPADDLATYETAVRYHMYHALGLILLHLVSRQFGTTLMDWIGIGFIVGIILFSGSLYLLVLTDTRWLGAITPFGGVAFLISWGLLGYSALTN